MTNLINANVIEWAASYTGPKFHAMLCDPPYELAFMGKHWDASGVAFDPATWAALAEHLLPGAFIFAFAGTRGYHRMACAIEDAGLIIHPAIGWAFGSGFPKATRVKDRPDFDGHRYGLQALKPAFEFIACAQVPYEGRPVDCITETGAGALWIEGGRIGTDEEAYFKTNLEPTNANGQVYGFAEYDALHKRGGGSPSGRWPSNLILSDDAAARMDEQSGERPTGGAGRNRQSEPCVFVAGGAYHNCDNSYGDTGGPSRYFYRVADQIDAADPVRYVAKASRRERDAGLEGMPLRLGGSLDGGNDTRNGKDKPQLHPVHNPHPTIKPLALTRYLATLLLPPSEYAPRRLLVPFCGSGSEVIGAIQAGWEDVTGIDLDAEYIDIARARVEYWSARPAQPKLLEVDR